MRSVAFIACVSLGENYEIRSHCFRSGAPQEGLAARLPSLSWHGWKIRALSRADWNAVDLQGWTASLRDYSPNVGFSEVINCSNECIGP
jgi:hypothetical protein